MKAARFLALALFASLSVATHAQIYSASAGFSVHSKGGFNGFNPGFGIRAADGDLAVQAGEYRNSYHKATAYIVGEWTPVHFGKVALGGFAGIAPAYTKDQDPVTPYIAGLSLRWQPGTYGAALKIVPPIGNGTAGMIAIEFTARLF
jgi:hypothetical protein